MILSVGGISRPPPSRRWNKHKGGYGHCHCAGVLFDWVLLKVKCLMHFLCFFLKFRHQIKANLMIPVWFRWLGSKGTLGSPIQKVTSLELDFYICLNIFPNSKGDLTDQTGKHYCQSYIFVYGSWTNINFKRWSHIKLSCSTKIIQKVISSHRSLAG